MFDYQIYVSVYIIYPCIGVFIYLGNRALSFQNNFPHFNGLTGKLKSRLTQLRILKKIKHIPVGLPNSPIKKLRKSAQGLPRVYLAIYRYR